MATERNMFSRERIMPVLSVIVGLSLVGMITAWIIVPNYSIFACARVHNNGYMNTVRIRTDCVENDRISIRL